MLKSNTCFLKHILMAEVEPRTAFEFDVERVPGLFLVTTLTLFMMGYVELFSRFRYEFSS
jgi:hypothetical protein